MIVYKKHETEYERKTSMHLELDKHENPLAIWN